MEIFVHLYFEEIILSCCHCIKNEMKFKNKNTLAEDLLKIIVFQPEIKDVILMGGGTRIPKVQEILKKFLGR